MGVTTNHIYQTFLEWTGNKGEGTANYRAYSRDHNILNNGPQTILGSSDPAFRGDASRYNPEELLIASIASCHMLWYLHLCAEAKINVISYQDDTEGYMTVEADGSGYFSEVILHPVITISEESDLDKAQALHQDAHKKCFVANSLNFPVNFLPTIKHEEKKAADA